MKAVKLAGVICAYVFIFQAIVLAQETLTVTTFYPSPNGSYLELRSRRMAIGDNYSLTTSVCWGATCAASAVVPDDADLLVEQRVGIGTLLGAAGQATDRLSVNGRVSIPGGQFLILDYNDATPTNYAIEAKSGGFNGVTAHGFQFRVQTGAPATSTRLLINNVGTTRMYGDVYAQGEFYSQTDAAGRGCLKMSYGSASGIMSCPVGLTLDLRKSSPISTTGGFIACCQ